MPESKKDLEFEAGVNKEYKVKPIMNSAVYGKQANDSDQMLDSYYFVLWKSYPKEKNTWEPSLAVIHLQKLINTFNNEYLEKPTATSLSLDSALSMARPTVLKE